MLISITFSTAFVFLNLSLTLTLTTSVDMLTGLARLLIVKTLVSKLLLIGHNSLVVNYVTSPLHLGQKCGKLTDKTASTTLLTTYERTTTQIIIADKLTTPPSIRPLCIKSTSNTYRGTATKALLF